jgi:hypothetical protein
MMIYYYLNVGENALYNLRTISLRSTNGMVVQLNKSAGIHPTSLSQVL